MTHAYKQVPKPERKYSPADAVRQYGDSWMLGINNVSPNTALALRSLSPDWNDAFEMRLMEKGVISRVKWEV